MCISSNVGSSISASLGVLNWEEISTSLAGFSSLRGSATAKARVSGLSGVELPDAGPGVSRTAWDRSLLTSMVILIWPSALGGKTQAGLPAGVGLKPLPKEGALGSCSSVADLERSTCRKVDLPPSRVMPWDWDSGRAIITGT